MKSKVFYFGLCAFIISLMLAPVNAMAADSDAMAADPYTLMQAHIDNSQLDIIAFGGLDLQSADVKVSNKQAEITDYGTVSEGNVRVRTTVLVDISTSIPYKARPTVLEFVEEKIKELDSYEELRLVTFGKKVEIIHDFSSDRYDLSNAAKEIKFKGNSSAVYDAVNSSMLHTELTDDSPCFYRTIVITDGADRAADGITKEELYLRLRTETYPIDVISVSADKPKNPVKDLAALSRISNGSYTDLYPSADVAECVSQVSADDFFWIRAEVPQDLLDGSTRQIDISDGNGSFSFDMKMSVVDAPIEKPPASEASSSSSSSVVQPVFTPPSDTLPDSTSLDEVEDDEGLQIDTTLLIIIIAAVAVVVAVIVVIIVSKKKAQRSQTIQHSNPVANSSIKIDATEYVEDAEGKEHYSIKISNAVNQNESWILDVFSDIIIGRADSCDIVIGEISVAHEQCKIAANKNGLAISNLSHSNKTKLNGTVVATEVPLHPADNIHFGRITLRVDYIQKVTDEISPQSPPPSSSSVGNTRSVF